MITLFRDMLNVDYRQKWLFQEFSAGDLIGKKEVFNNTFIFLTMQIQYIGVFLTGTLIIGAKLNITAVFRKHFDTSVRIIKNYAYTGHWCEFISEKPPKVDFFLLEIPHCIYIYKGRKFVGDFWKIINKPIVSSLLTDSAVTSCTLYTVQFYL